jgi:hypothetical protein
MDSRKRSQIVGLSLIGLPLTAVGLANLTPDEKDVRRNLYPDRAACERDYRRDQCEDRTGSSSGSSGRGGSVHGPYYYADRNSPEARSDPGPGRTGQVTHTEASTRGGFGAVGRALGASA